MSLLFPPFYLLQNPVANGDAKAPTIEIQAQDKEQESDNNSRLYQDVYISREGLQSYLEYEFSKYGIERQIGRAKKVIQCESGWNMFAYNIKDEKWGGSFGIAQFLPSTFRENCKGEYKNPFDQISCMAKMWKNGGQHRWSCYLDL